MFEIRIFFGLLSIEQSNSGTPTIKFPTSKIVIVWCFFLFKFWFFADFGAPLLTSFISSFASKTLIWVKEWKGLLHNDITSFTVHNQSKWIWIECFFFLSNKSIGKCLGCIFSNRMQKQQHNIKRTMENSEDFFLLVRQFHCRKKIIALISVLSTNVVTLMCSYLIPFACFALSLFPPLPSTHLISLNSRCFSHTTNTTCQ